MGERERNGREDDAERTHGPDQREHEEAAEDEFGAEDVEDVREHHVRGGRRALRVVRGEIWLVAGPDDDRQHDRCADPRQDQAHAPIADPEPVPPRVVPEQQEDHRERDEPDEDEPLHRRDPEDLRSAAVDVLAGHEVTVEVDGSPATITQIATVARIGSRSPTIVVVARSSGVGG